MVLKNQLAAGVATALIQTFMFTLTGSGNISGNSAIVAVGGLLLVFATQRFGLVAAVCAVFVVSVLTQFPLWNVSAWYAAVASAAPLIVLSLSFFGYARRQPVKAGYQRPNRRPGC